MKSTNEQETFYPIDKQKWDHSHICEYNSSTRWERFVIDCYCFAPWLGLQKLRYWIVCFVVRYAAPST